MAPPSASTSPTATRYKGHCHCGAFRYVATFPRPLAPTPHSLSAPSDPATATADESTHAKCIPEAEKEGGNSKTAAEATVAKVGSLGLKEEVTEEQASEDKSQIASCNCSICQRNGYLIVHLCKDDVEITKGKMEDLSTYEFGLNHVVHRFCGTCGSSLFIDALEKFSILGLNIRHLVDVDIKKLKVNDVDG